MNLLDFQPKNASSVEGKKCLMPNCMRMRESMAANARYCKSCSELKIRERSREQGRRLRDDNRARRAARATA
jgi:hypothetical protein